MTEHKIKQVPLDEHKVKQVPLDIKGHRMLFYAMPYYCCKEASYIPRSKMMQEMQPELTFILLGLRYQISI